MRWALDTANDTYRVALNNAALYAYHASIQWGMVATNEGATVFNSHWVRRDEWFQMPLIPWNEAEQQLEVFQAITPTGLSEGQLDEIATRAYTPDKFLRAVDDTLVHRMDYWRDQTLRFSRQIENIDEILQTLFAQLFVLRTVEDKRLAPELNPLSTILKSGMHVDKQGLSQLLRDAQRVVGSELFEVDTLSYVPEESLGGIINDLYVPYHLPSGDRYNFAWIDADILGHAYEKYLSTVLSPAPLSLQKGLFEEPIREVERVTVRKSGGVYYTPNFLVQYLSERSIEELGDLDPRNLPRVADFACGSGSFLVAATNAIIRQLREVDADRNWARELFEGRHIIGVDVDERAVIATRLNLWIRCAEEPHPFPLPRLADAIVLGDSLGEEVWQKIPDTYSIVLGNPPFLATAQTPGREELSGRFITAQGRFDYSYLFIELAVKHLERGGLLGLVIPNRLFKNRDAGLIRELLTSQADLCTIVDFGSTEVFVGTSAYIGSIIARRLSPEPVIEATTVRVLQVSNLTPQFITALLMAADNYEGGFQNSVLTAYDAPHPRGRDPWVLLSPVERRFRARLDDVSERLDSVAGVYQGIRTGANDIFIVQAEVVGDSRFVKVVNGLGDTGVVERALLHLVVFGSDIQRYDVVQADKFLIYPYHSNVVIPEQELRNSFPKTFTYLERYRDLLAARGSIEAGGLRWYELVRKRDEGWLNSPKLLTRDLAMETSFAPDLRGDTYLVGGTAVVPTDLQLLLPLLAYLNSSLVNDFLRQITPSFRRGFQKFEPQHLNRVPVVTAVFDNSDLLARLTTYVNEVIQFKQSSQLGDSYEAEEKINEVIFEAVGVNSQILN